MPRMFMGLVVWGIVVAPTLTTGQTVTQVQSDQELRAALSSARAGTTIQIAPGIYQGGMASSTLQGESDKPIVIAGQDPKNPPTIKGGNAAFHLSGATHVEIRDLIFTNASGNGLNLDDGGTKKQPSHHIKIRNVKVTDVGPEGNHDGFKLSGIDEFEVSSCLFERWGSGGSGIDMVGCHKGTIANCTFRYNDRVQANGVQAKGGSQDIAVRYCRFEHAGNRGVNLGGSTGTPYFRPLAPGYEAKNITVEHCTFIGCQAPVAFVGVDGAIVRRNTMYQPGRWALRILQENRDPSFVPSRNGQFYENIIAFRFGELAQAINIGPGTAPDTFRLDRNAWYCVDRPTRSQPKFDVPESDGIYGRDPEFQDVESLDLRLKDSSQLRHLGAQPEPVAP